MVLIFVCFTVIVASKTIKPCRFVSGGHEAERSNRAPEAEEDHDTCREGRKSEV